MTGKPISLVAHILNLLFTPVDRLPQVDRLLPVDRLLLIALARHQGPKGICPSTTLLAKELGMTPTYIKRLINKLDELKTIKVTRKVGCRHQYEFLFIPENQSTTVDRSTTVDLSTTGLEPVNHSFGTGQPQLTQSNKKKTELNRERRAPLASAPSDFSPDDKNTLYAVDHRLDLAEELESFKSRHKGPKNQYEFGRWLQKGHEYQQRLAARNATGNGKQEIRSTVPEYGPGHPRWEMLHGTSSTEH